MLNFYDFEVFKCDWMVVIINPVDKAKTIIINDKKQLEEYHELHKNEIWIGYNSRNYDQYILKGILCGFDPKEINDYIIVEKKKGWQYSSLLQKIQLFNYDVAKLNDGGLKTLEAYMGNDIRETSVPFDIDRKLTKNEIEETIKYCTHDVEQTIEVFLNRKNDFDAHMSLIKTFKLPMNSISKTQAQLSAKILNCRNKERCDEWEIEIVPTLKLSKYKYVLDWFKNQIKQKRYTNALETEIACVPHSFGWGGAHGALKKVHKKGLIIHVDVTSFYPSLMIVYKFLTRNSRTPFFYKEIYDTRVEMKKAGKKKEQAPYKIVLNATYGISKDKFSPAYDPRQANNICINGQLLLLDLIEKLEKIPNFQLIQSNTDGLIIQIPDTNTAFRMVDDICNEWEKRTGMGLGFDFIDEIWQKDVNNYIFHFEDINENGKNKNKYERKGSYVQEYDVLKNDLTIVNEAIYNYMTRDITPEETILNCDDFNKFQKVVKVSSKYYAAYHNNERLNEKVNRVFASVSNCDGSIYKQKKIGATLEKFANTPEKCFIFNDEISSEILNKLDRQWYINLAKKRLIDYGCEQIN